VIVTFDTNILVYAVDFEAGPRHQRAADLVERAIRHRLGIITLQALGEFFNVLTRKMRVEAKAAAELVEGWMAALPVHSAGDGELADAMRVVREHRMQFWDAMLWAAARRAGIRYLLTEDLQDGRTLEGVTFLNPFAPGNVALIDRHLPAANVQ
jgi:predicted nucleic acid-binding protein